MGKHTRWQNTPPTCVAGEHDLIFTLNLEIALRSSEPVTVVMSAATFASPLSSLPPARLVLNQTLLVKGGTQFTYQRNLPSSVFIHLFSATHQLP